MPTQVEKPWKCDLCGAEYSTVEEAQQCGGIHRGG